MLSGGEKVRLMLCKILKRRPNILILDEPTNHMDMIGKETLENMLQKYQGTLIFVSHDRYFVKKVATRLLSFEEEGLRLYPFGYEEYEEKRLLTLKEEALHSDRREKPSSKQSVYNPGKERSKLEKKLKKLEERLAEEEAVLDALREEYEDPENQSRYGKLTELQEKMDASEETVLSCMAEWDAVSEELKQYAENR